MTFSSEFVYKKLQALEQHTKELKDLLQDNKDNVFRNLRKHFSNFENYQCFIVDYLKKMV